MQRIAVISYTEKGGQLNDRLVEHLRSKGDVAVSYTGSQDMTFLSTRSLLEQEWNCVNAFIFIGATGIAVRQIAPFLEDKAKDPAVLVLDELAQFVIPVLSGHIGGGVALSWRIAAFLGAQAAITTATDVEGYFAVDVFAERNHLRIHDLAAAKAVSAAILRGETVKAYTGVKMSGDVPAGIRLCKYSASDNRKYAAAKNNNNCYENDGIADEKVKANVGAAYREDERIPDEDTMREHIINSMCFECADGQVCVLSPRHYIVGIGCRKGKSADDLDGMLRQICEQYRIDTAQIAGLASIDLKREEIGIWELSRRLGVPYEVFPGKELEQIDETVDASEFVRQTVGVDNVCERSALCLAGRWCDQSSDVCDARNSQMSESMQDNVDGSVRLDISAPCRLVVRKQARDGMTMAVAQFRQRVYWW